MIRSFQTFERLAHFSEELWPVRLDIETAMAAREIVPIYCSVCERKTDAKVSIGAYFGHQPNLREGLHCFGCNMGNRNRLMAALVRMLAPPGAYPRVAMFEALSPLSEALRQTGYELFNSSYLPHTGGNLHQDMTRTTYKSGSFDLVVHNDVLEHVPNTLAALKDNARILRPGGMVIFTAPLVPMRQTITRARLNADGALQHLLPPEIHGDPLAPEGVLAFYNFGFDVLELVRKAGLADANLTVWYDPALGFTSNNHPEQTRADGSRFGNMHPCAVVARKPAWLDRKNHTFRQPLAF